MRHPVLIIAAAMTLGCSPQYPVNDSCDESDECASGVCHRGICALEEPILFGHSCTGDGECASYNCSAEICQRGMQSEAGECRNAEECASGACTHGACMVHAVCGDRKREGSEACDGNDLQKQTCGSLGFDGGELSCHGDCTLDSSECIAQTWVRIEAGRFIMGSAKSDPQHATNESQHQVTLSRPFEIASKEVSQRQFRLLRGYSPSAFHAQGVCAAQDCPVESINWAEAAAYCNALSDARGLPSCYQCTSSGKTVYCETAPSFTTDISACLGYRLPTEAEWEYAYRAGGEEAFYGGLKPDTIGWSENNSAGSPHPVGQKAANAWGLFDLGGNVFEWCHDWYSDSLGSTPQVDPMGPPGGSARVTRGGSWHFEAHRMRGAARLFSRPDARLFDTGFRCARTLEDSTAL